MNLCADYTAYFGVTYRSGERILRLEAVGLRIAIIANLTHDLCAGLLVYPDSLVPQVSWVERPDGKIVGVLVPITLSYTAFAQWLYARELGSRCTSFDIRTGMAENGIPSDDFAQMLWAPWLPLMTGKLKLTA